MESLRLVETQTWRARLGERARQWLRKDRVFVSGTGWYFRTREGIAVGPYSSRFEAEIEADILIARLARDATAQSLRVIRAFMMESVQETVIQPERPDIGANLGR